LEFKILERRVNNVSDGVRGFCKSLSISVEGIIDTVLEYFLLSLSFYCQEEEEEEEFSNLPLSMFPFLWCLSLLLAPMVQHPRQFCFVSIRSLSASLFISGFSTLLVFLPVRQLVN